MLLVSDMLGFRKQQYTDRYRDQPIGEHPLFKTSNENGLGTGTGHLYK